MEDQTRKSFRDVAAILDTSDDLLSDVTAFVKTDGVVQTSLGDDICLVHINSKTRNARLQPQDFQSVIPNRRGTGVPPVWLTQGIFFDTITGAICVLVMKEASFARLTGGTPVPRQFFPQRGCGCGFNEKVESIFTGVSSA